MAVDHDSFPRLASTAVALASIACGSGSSGGPGIDASTHDGGDASVASVDATEDVTDAAVLEAPDDFRTEEAAPLPCQGPPDAGCGDLVTDPHNCGACGADCDGGACEEASCVALAQGVLATGLRGPFAIGVDDTSVYWLDYGTGCVIPGGTGGPLPVKPITVPPVDGAVMKCAKGGCGNHPTVLVSGQTFTGQGVGPANFALAATTVYWSAFVPGTGGAVLGCTISGCGGGPLLLWSGQAGARGIATDASHVYWTGGNRGTDVVDCPSTGCAGPPAVLASGQNLLTGIATDGVDVYWRNLGQILSCPVSGCGGAPTVLASGQSTTGGPLAVDGTSVYWLDTSTFAGDAVMKCAKPGCGGSPSVLASGGSNSVGLATDGTNVYWTASSSVFRCAPAGCSGAPTVVAQGLQAPGAVAVDATRVYWTEGGLSTTSGRIAWASK